MKRVISSFDPKTDPTDAARAASVGYVKFRYHTVA